MGVRERVKKILIGREDRRYDRLLAKRQVSYEEWLERQKGQSRAERHNAVGKKTSEEFVLFLAAEGIPAEDCVENIACYFEENPDCLLLYGDEDMLRQSRYQCPWFKPGWSPDLLDTFFYFGSLVAVRRTLLAKCPGLPSGKNEKYKGVSCLRVTEPLAYAEWILQCVRRAGGYEKGNRSAVGHIDRILFHGTGESWQDRFPGADRQLQKERRAENLRQLLDCCGEQEGKSGHGQEKEQTQENVPEYALTVIVPSKDNPEMLERCLRALNAAAGELSFETVVVDNGSTDDNRRRIEGLMARLEKEGVAARYLYRPREFNFSEMCNEGAAAAKGRFYLFLNDDVELVEQGCLERLAALARRDYTGAVGIKLCYPDSGRIQHVGITNLPMGPVHKLQFLEDNKRYYDDFSRGCRNFLAVTGACLMVDRKKFREAGGFAEELRVAFNDVDFCFRLYELGYYNVCDNDSFAYHYESFSRGNDEAPEKLERLMEERARLFQRHLGLEGKDPYYAWGLGREGLDVGIRPAYLTAGNRVQELSRPERTALKDCRQDNCLMVRAEDFRDRKLTGWSVVLGDDNACYAKHLLLKRLPGTAPDKGQGAAESKGKGLETVESKGQEVAERKRQETAESRGQGAVGENAPGIAAEECQEQIWEVQLEGSYRPDLEENMPEQRKVGLCGFCVRLEEKALEPGQYLVGMYARNRVTGLKLVNWSNRRIVLRENEG